MRPRPLAAVGAWDVVVGRAIPASVFFLLVAAQASRAEGAMAAAVHGPSPAGGLRAANAVLTLVYFTLLSVLYVVRLPPRHSDRRPGIVVASFAGSFIVMCVPFLTSIQFLPSVPFLPAGQPRAWLLLPAVLLMSAGIAYSIWSLLFLRRSFSILPQARRLVTGGPYGLSRNPLYLGEVLGSWALYLPTMSWLVAFVLAVNVGLLLVRVRAEERVLASSFGDEYADYCWRVPRFLPRPWRAVTRDELGRRSWKGRHGPRRPLRESV